MGNHSALLVFMNRYFEKDYTFSKAEEVEQKEAYNRIVNKCRKKSIC